MKEGWFTGKKLSNYITLQKSDFLNARRIVNGMDKAKEIEALAKQYDKELLDAGYGVESTEKPADGHKDGQATDGKENIFIVLLRLLIKLLTGGR